MFWLMLGASVLSEAGGIVGRANERKNAQAEIDQKLKELNLDTAQGVTSLENQKIADKAQAEASAMQIGNETRAGQLEARDNLLGMQAEGKQSAGNLAASAAAGGLEGRTTVQDVLNENIQTAVNQERDRIGTAVSGANMQIDQMRRSFQPGSAYMNMYQSKKDSILQGAAMQESFLSERRKAYDYDANWFAQDLFDVAGTAANFAAQGAANKWWGGPNPAKKNLLTPYGTVNAGRGY
jgi:hypothetical protein